MDFDEFLDDCHPWLTDIAAEVQTLMREFGRAKNRAKLFEWSEAVDAVHKQIDEFDDRREAYFVKRVLYDARLRDEAAGPPEDGWNWGYERVGPDAYYKPTFGWAPPELCRTRRPEVKLPIPIPDRPLTLPEKHAALAAIHDRCWKGEKINPWPVPTKETDVGEVIAKLRAGQHYHAILYRVPNIQSNDERFVREILRDVSDDWQSSGESLIDSKSEQSPNSGTSLPESNEYKHFALFQSMLSVYSKGLSDQLFAEVILILQNSDLEADEKLTNSDAILPFPPTASAEALGKMIGKSKSMVQKTPWWKNNRKGKGKKIAEKRRQQHAHRSKQSEPPPEKDEFD